MAVYHLLLKKYLICIKNYFIEYCSDVIESENIFYSIFFLYLYTILCTHSILVSKTVPQITFNYLCVFVPFSRNPFLS